MRFGAGRGAAAIAGNTIAPSACSESPHMRSCAVAGGEAAVAVEGRWKPWALLDARSSPHRAALGGHQGIPSLSHLGRPRACAAPRPPFGAPGATPM